MKFKTTNKKDSHRLRHAFVDKFADKGLPQYNAVMGYGEAYGSSAHNGKLFEVLRPFTLISFDVALSMLEKSEELLITWDTCAMRDNKALPRTMLISISGKVLATLLKTNSKALPETIYAFDESLDFHITFTEMHLSAVGRVCFTSKTDLPETGISPLVREMFELTGFGEGESFK